MKQKTKNTEPSIKSILEEMLGQNYVETDSGTLFTDEMARKLEAHYLTRQDEVVKKVIGENTKMSSPTFKARNQLRTEQRQTYKKLKEGKV